MERRVGPWLFRVDPHPGESFGHFLGRFRRANRLSSKHLSAMLEVNSHVVDYWETPSRRRRPNKAELKQLSGLTGVAPAEFGKMWPRKGTLLYLPTRLCPHCYAKEPWHRLAWQKENAPKCDRHRLKLLQACPGCGSAFRLPCEWERGECDLCRMPFGEMGS